MQFPLKTCEQNSARSAAVCSDIRIDFLVFILPARLKTEKCSHHDGKDPQRLCGRVVQMLDLDLTEVRHTIDPQLPI